MNPILQQILETKTVVTEDGRSLPIETHHIPVLECQLIQAWLAQYAPKRLLEIGLAYGISALHICDAIPDWDAVSYHIIDIAQSTTWQSIGMHNLTQAGYGNFITLHEESSQICLPHFMAQGQKFDFALIDGEHLFDYVLVDFFFVSQMLDIGGIVLFDDVDSAPVAKILAYVNTLAAFKPLELPPEFARHITGRVRRMQNLPPYRVAGFEKVAPDKRSWTDFRDF